VQADPEGERGAEGDDPGGDPDQGRAHGHRRRTSSPLQGHPQPGHPARRQAGLGGRVGKAGWRAGTTGGTRLVLLAPAEPPGRDGGAGGDEHRHGQQADADPCQVHQQAGSRLGVPRDPDRHERRCQDREARAEYPADDAQQAGRQHHGGEAP
jgi:hypothetical protein